MRTGNQPQFLQVSHDIADGGRGKFQPEARDSVREPTVALFDIALDQRFEQQLGTVIQHGMILMM